MSTDRVRVVDVDSGDILDVYSVDARELIASGQYIPYVEAPVEPTEGGNQGGGDDNDDKIVVVDRESVKSELTSLGVEFFASAPTPFLVKLLEEEKAKIVSELTSMEVEFDASAPASVLLTLLEEEKAKKD